MSNKSSTDIISVPKGGGALSGIGEKFSPDIFTGTGNYSIPIELPPGRNGFQPELSLVYSTGNGNSPFGLGWSLSVPEITRKTSKGLPQYNNDDVFLLSSKEDLVEVARAGGVITYRPRTDTSFLRIEHHCNDSSGSDFWKVWSRDGTISIYGTPRPTTASSNWIDPATITNPDNPGQIFAWKITETCDTYCNRIQFAYERDAVRKDGPHSWDQNYLSSIRYIDYGDTTNPTFLVNVDLTYDKRPDPFSNYRSGFEIRTIQRCKSIDVWTNPGGRHRVRSYFLTFLDETGIGPDDLPHNGSSLLAEVKVEGHDEAAGKTQRLPPLKLTYGMLRPAERHFQTVTGPELPPASVGHFNFELVDLMGNGLPDILEMGEGVTRYWRNLGEARFDRPLLMFDAPAGLNLGDTGVQLIDADGNGRTDLVVTWPSLAGYYPLSFKGGWERNSFHPWDNAPSFNFDDPEVKLVDLDGDGVTDLVRSSTRFECYFNDSQKGWHATRRVQRRTLDSFPNVNFSDPRVKWADMTGDGLTDIVLVHDGRIDYWPAIGRGDFAPRITMRRSPRLPYGYDPRRLLLGDVDGDGVADLLYVDDRRVFLWINRSGNDWSNPIEIQGTPAVTDIDDVRLVDLLGTGVLGILWSRDATVPHRDTMFFLDFLGGHKPYLLERIDNCMGVVTNIGYSTSTNFYLTDTGTPQEWKSSLPFPVNVVAQVESIDLISGGKLTIEYDYHHGYWDGIEHEFRGFGRVDQRDTEVFEEYHRSGLSTEDRAFNTVERRFFSPPTETRTWFHLGAVGEEASEWRHMDYSGEFWVQDPNIFDISEELEDTLSPLSLQAQRDAVRSLRGKIIRIELYARDESERADHPYTVTELVQGIRMERAPDNDKSPGVFFPFMFSERTTHWERGDDPMTRLEFYGDYNAYGQPRMQLSVAVPRGRPYQTRAAESSDPFLATCSVTDYARRSDATFYIVDRVAHQTKYEIIDDGRSDSEGQRPSAIEFWNHVKEWLLGTGVEPMHRVIEQTLYHYDGPDFLGRPIGELGDHGALKRTETLVLTESLLHEGYRTSSSVSARPEEPPYFARDGNIAWANEYPSEFRNRISKLAYTPPSGKAVVGGYIFHAGNATEERGFFAVGPQRTHSPRGLVTAERDPLGNETSILYEDGFDLLPTKVIDPGTLETTVIYDYRALQPKLITDQNGNEIEYRYTPLGLLNEIAVVGKPGKNEGDTVSSPSTKFEYDLDAFLCTGEPISTHTTRRTHHVNDPDNTDEFIETREFFDGFSRRLQTRTSAEDVLFGSNDFGSNVLPTDQSQISDATGKTRLVGQPSHVVVSGFQTFDNKGRVVEEYEPFFSTGWAFAEATSVQKGQKTTYEYDPRGRVVRTINPNGSYQITVFGVPHDLTNPESFAPTPWERYSYDENDNAGRTQAVDPASTNYLHHWNTPISIVVDALGRTVEQVERNGPSPHTDWYMTRQVYDIRGNVLKVWDQRDRLAYQRVFDLADREIRTEQVDSGVRRIVFDAAGEIMELRDSKGAVALCAHDELRRPTHVWARDNSTERMSLRERVIYGDSAESGQTSQQATTNNLLGKPYKHYDEAGLLIFEEYDFKGNVAEKVRQVISNSQILSAFIGAATRSWTIPAYRVNWEHASNSTLDTHAAGILDPTTYRTSQTFDALGRHKHIDYPQDIAGERKQLELVYNRAGALERMLFDGDVFVEHIAYNAKGQRTLIAYGDRDTNNPGPRIMTRYAYKPETSYLARLRTEKYRSDTPFSFTSQSGTLQDIAYKYDLAGNVLEIDDRTPGAGVPGCPNRLSRLFGYDPLYRLTSAMGRECSTSFSVPWDPSPRCNDVTKTRVYTQSYEYDPTGNMKHLKHRLTSGSALPTRYFDLAPGTNHLTVLRIGTTSNQYQYDSAGNMTQENTSRHLEWDHANRLRVFSVQTNAAEPSIHVHYLYDAGGQRIKKLVRKQGGRVEVTVYIDGLFEHHEVDRAGTTNNFNILHLLDDESRIATVRVGNDPDDNTPAVKFHLGDHLGSSVITLDQAGVWVNREEFTPYGETSFGSFAKKRFRHTGKERDIESGFTYFGFRYYASWLCRWTSPDPVGAADGLNPFQYVGANPMGHIDKEGLQEETPADRARQMTVGPGPDAASVPPRAKTASPGFTFSADAIEQMSIPVEVNNPRTGTIESYSSDQIGVARTVEVEDLKAEFNQAAFEHHPYASDAYGRSGTYSCGVSKNRALLDMGFDAKNSVGNRVIRNAVFAPDKERRLRRDNAKILNFIDTELAHGRPVSVLIDYKPGRAAVSDGVSDHSAFVLARTVNRDGVVTYSVAENVGTRIDKFVIHPRTLTLHRLGTSIKRSGASQASMWNNNSRVVNAAGVRTLPGTSIGPSTGVQ